MSDSTTDGSALQKEKKKNKKTKPCKDPWKENASELVQCFFGESVPVKLTLAFLGSKQYLFEF